MKTIEQLEAEIAQLQQDLERLKSKPEPIIERTDKYTCVNSYFSAQTDTDRGYVNDNLRYENYNYYPEDGELCQKVADYLKRTHLFTRKAIEFADGYEFIKDDNNHFVSYIMPEFTFYKITTYGRKHPQIIYMSEENAKKFAKWCNAYRKELGYD